MHYWAEYINSLALLGRAYLAQYQSASDATVLVAAASEYLTAVEVADKGAEEDPAGFAVELGSVRTTLADIYVVQGRLDHPRTLYDSVLTAYNKAGEAAAAYPRFHTWSRIGYLRLKERNTPGAVQAFEQAQSCVGSLSAQEKQVYRREVLDTQHRRWWA